MSQVATSTHMTLISVNGESRKEVVQVFTGFIGGVRKGLASAFKRGSYDGDFEGGQN